MAVWNLEIEESDRPKLFCDLFLKIHFFSAKYTFSVEKFIFYPNGVSLKNHSPDNTVYNYCII